MLIFIAKDEVELSIEALENLILTCNASLVCQDMEVTNQAARTVERAKDLLGKFKAIENDFD